VAEDTAGTAHVGAAGSNVWVMAAVGEAMMVNAAAAEAEAGSGPGISDTRCCGGLGLGDERERETGERERWCSGKAATPCSASPTNRGAGEIDLNLQLILY
jgi:hypothetical protein